MRGQTEHMVRLAKMESLQSPVSMDRTAESDRLDLGGRKENVVLMVDKEKTEFLEIQGSR